MRRHSLSRTEVAFVVGVPLVWAVLLLFHPTGDGDEYYPIISDSVTPWLIVHLGTMLLIPLLAGAMFVLLRGIDGNAALISRIALMVFAVVYTAYEVTVGIGSGILAANINDLPPGEQAAGADLLQRYNESNVITVLSTVGSLAWLVAVTAAGVALYQRARAATSVAVVALFLISAPGIVIHVTPFGPAGLALFIVALILVVRAMMAPAAQPMIGQPGAA